MTPEASLKSKTINSVKWTYVSTIAGILLQIVYTGIMARLLMPTLFGLVAMAGVFLRFGTYFSQMGLSQVLIQKRELTNDEIGVAFVVSAVVGFGFTLLFALGAPLAAILFKEHRIIKIIYVLALSFFLDGVFVTPLSLIQREMEFKFLSLVNIISYLVGYLFVGVWMAYSGFGVWSLVVATLSQKFVYGVIILIHKRHSLKIRMNVLPHLSLLKLGSQFSLVGFEQFLGYSILPFATGRFLGAYDLGLYNSSIRLSNLPIENLANTLARVLFPGFSQIQNNQVKLKSAYLSGLLFVAVLVFPIAFGMFVCSRDIVLAVLGSQWRGAIPILKILVIVAPFTFIATLNGLILDSLALLRGKIIIESGFFLTLGLAVFINRNNGLMTFVYIYLVTELLKSLAYHVLVKHTLQVSLKEMWLIFKPVVLITLLVSLSIVIVGQVAEAFVQAEGAILLINIAVGIVMLVLSVFIIQDKVLNNELLRIFEVMVRSTNRGSRLGKYFGAIINKLMTRLTFA